MVSIYVAPPRTDPELKGEVCSCHRCGQPLFYVEKVFSVARTGYYRGDKKKNTVIEPTSVRLICASCGGREREVEVNTEHKRVREIGSSIEGRIVSEEGGMPFRPEAMAEVTGDGGGRGPWLKKELYPLENLIALPDDLARCFSCRSIAFYAVYGGGWRELVCGVCGKRFVLW